MNLIMFALFIGIISAAWIGGHYYLASRLNSVLSGICGGRISSRFIKFALILAALSFLIGEILTRFHHLQNVGPTGFILRQISITGSIWGGIFSIGISIFILRDLFLLLPGARKSNRLFVFSGSISLALTIILSAAAIWRGTRLPIVVEYNLSSKKLPAGVNFTIIQISDLHINYAKSPEYWLMEIVSNINRHNPDIVVITGDIMDIGNLCSEGKYYCAVLKKIKSRRGVYAVAGNHECYVGYENFRRFAEQSDIKILENENVFIPLGGAATNANNTRSSKKQDLSDKKNGNGIILIGIPDDEAGRFGKKNSAPDFSKSILGADIHKNYSILLKHRPSDFEKHSDQGIDLQLSGHLHAGQIPPMDLIIYLAFRYPKGLYRRGNSFIHTASGTSTWGPPMRLFSRNEIVKFTITGLD